MKGRVLCRLAVFACLVFSLPNVGATFAYENPQRIVSAQTSPVIYGTTASTHQAVSSLWTQNADFDASWDSVRTFNLMSPMNKPLKVYVETHPKDATLYRPQLRTAVAEGLVAWSAALSGNLKYTFTENPDEANIKVYWVAAFADKEQAGEADCTLEDAVIHIKTKGLPDNIIEGNIMHELGHALGISGHSTRNDDIMSTGREWSSRHEYDTYQARLTQDDVLAIRRLYGLSWKKGEDLYQAVRRIPSRPTVALKSKKQ